MISSKEALAIAEIVFYVPALVVAVLVCLRHGFGREFGWFSLLLLAVVRIIGSACEVAAASTTVDRDVVITAIVLASGGLATLLLAMLGILKRVYGISFD